MLSSSTAILEREIKAATSSAEVDSVLQLRTDLGRIESISSRLDEQLRFNSRVPGRDIRIIDIGELRLAHGDDIAREICQPLIDQINAHGATPGWTGVVKEVTIKDKPYQYVCAVRNAE